MHELIKQPRLSNSRLAHHGDNLTMSLPRLLQGFAKLLGFSITPDKSSKTATGRGLEPRPHRTRARNFINFNGVRSFPSRDRTKRLHLHVAFGQL